MFFPLKRIYKDYSSKLFLILVIFFLFTSLAFVIFDSEKLFFKYDHQIFKQRYLNSQWVIPNSKKTISDEDLYIYAGNEYIRGTSPILINPEILPLPKYLIGLITVLFGNPYLTGLIFLFFIFIFRL